MTTEEEKREQVIQDLAEELRRTPFSVEFKVKKKPVGIKIIFEVTQEEMDKMAEDACQRQHKEKPKFNVGDVMRTIKEAEEGWIDGMPVVVSIDENYYRCNNEIIPIPNQDQYEYPPINRKEE